MPESERKLQAGRCMDCSVPFCQSGQLMDGRASGCPIHNLIPEWNELIFKNQWKEAYERLAKTNNFPEFTGRICPAPCEGSCTVGISLAPVTIKHHEFDIIERAFQEGWVVARPPSFRTGKKVAIIGSGPAGLACADQLNQLGHSVTVFERDDRLGGLLMYGIPNMKLEKSVVMRRIQLLQDEGIVFKTNIEVSKDILVTQIKSEFDATVLCCGASKPRNLVVPGRNFSGIHYAMEYLKGTTKRILNAQNKNDGYISAKGLDVVVIGGGDTGTDCVATAIRQECKSIVQFEINVSAPLERYIDNPWPQWPKVFKVDYGHEEAMALFGNDPRSYQTATKEFLADETGNVIGVKTVQVILKKDHTNGRIVEEIPGTEKIWPAQLVLLSLGFTGPEDDIVQHFELEQSARTNVKTSRRSYATSKEGVFVAGDMHRGQSLVVWAIQEGREAAKECHNYLVSNLKI